jgi:esterase/lipase superfamily enzyme
MSDDLRVRERWFSDRLQTQVTVVRWGVLGVPVLVFPSAGGDAEEIERHGLVNACGPLLAEGRIKLYSVDSVAGQAMVTKAGSVEHRLWLLGQFHEFVRWEVVPAIHADLGGRAIDVITTGASIGVFPVTQDEHGGDIHGEHVEPDIPGAWPAVDVHGGGAVFTVSRRAAPVTP